MNEEQVVEYLKQETNKDFLTKHGFQTEKIVEKQVEITETGVQEFLKKNPNLVKIYEEQGVNSFLKEKLGKDVTPEILQGGLMEANILDNVKSNIIGELLKSNSYKDLIIPKLDLTKVEVTGSGITGLAEQLTELEKLYPALFTLGGGGTKTPPAGKVDTNTAEIEKIENEIKELEKQGYSVVNRSKIMILVNKKNELLGK